jgi:thiol-disulfide isomerase/thioredoxin
MSNARILCFALVAILSLACSSDSLSQQRDAFVGKLGPDLINDDASFSLVTLNPISPEVTRTLPAPLTSVEQAFSGRLNWYALNRSASFTIVLIESADGPTVVYADLDQNGKFSSNESVGLTAGKTPRELDEDFHLKIPFPVGPFSYYPFLVRRFGKGGPPHPAGKRVLGYTTNAFVQGRVNIDGRSVLVRYGLDPETKTVNLTKGPLRVDCNGNGRIDAGTWSPETDYAKDELVVFRVGGRYVSTESVDLETGKIVLRDHPAINYKRIELGIGSRIPDFSFVDLNGKTHKLSEYHGKYLLLDFWGTWCGPCMWEIPHLLTAYAKYRSSGFEILGMDTEHEPGKIEPFIKEKGIPWIQATTESIEDLVKNRFRVNSWPRHILLDPDGKVVSLGEKGQLPLNGAGLLTTLDKLLIAK